MLISLFLLSLENGFLFSDIVNTSEVLIACLALFPFTSMVKLSFTSMGAKIAQW